MDMMKVDATLIRQLREARAWSQEHLASVAGVSLRTIQRVESDGSASAETRMAIATAFDIDVAQLNLLARAPDPIAEGTAPEPPTATPQTSTLKLSRLQYRCLRFLIVASLLVGFDEYRNDAITWSKWVVLFWAVLLLLRLLRAQLVEPSSAPRR